MFKVPKNYFFRLHHVRPRFKSDIENVLIFMASEISNIGVKPSKEFKTLVNNQIRRFPGNMSKAKKTIDNWRTEISSLFGFFVKDDIAKTTAPGRRADELTERQDLVEMFKKFLYCFQYPGGHNKPYETVEFISHGIRFHPAQYILELLDYAEKAEGKRIALSKAEATHCIFNDLRCTRDKEGVAATWARIRRNKEEQVKYDWTGDVIRYAGDILDYMEAANLLVSHGSNFYLNHLEDTAIHKFISGDVFFKAYDEMISNCRADLDKVKGLQYEWFTHVNQPMVEDFFETDILALISEDEEDYQQLKKASIELLEQSIEDGEDIVTKEIGDWGEALVHGHECMRLKIGERSDLIHLVKKIPTHLAVGYDVQSREFDGRMRLVEVKSTISSKPITFTKFHLTPNEWMAAESYKDRYYVYRLSLSKGRKKLFILQDPVNLYKTDKLQMVPRDGADISFTKECGNYEELLEWTN